MEIDNPVDRFLESDYRSWAPFEIHAPKLLDNLLCVVHFESLQGLVVSCKKGASTILPAGFNEPSIGRILAQLIVPA